VDWNKDGKKDLLVGEREGHIRIYLNKGTDAAPFFSGYDNLSYSSGTAFDCGLNAIPAIVDWNKDGKMDVLCGDDEGRIVLLINTGTISNPVFSSSSQSFIQNGGLNLDAGTHASPAVVDWNRDGKKDIIVGNGDGNLLYFENKGSDQSPVFNGLTMLSAGGTTIDVKYNARPDVKDWNGDGVMDILCGNYSSSPDFTGHVIYFEARGPLSLTSNYFHAGKGAEIGLNLSAGSANAHRNYIIVGSISGTEPGTPLPGGKVTLPINWDVYTDLIFLLMNSQLFYNFMGTLSATGGAKAEFDTKGPISSVAVGLTVHYAFALNAPWNYASNAAGIEILP
jgi:hypothetical protein